MSLPILPTCIALAGRDSTPDTLRLYLRHTLATVERTRNFGLGKVGELAELGHRNVGAGRLVEVLTDALQEDLGSAVFGAGKLGCLLRANADLGHNGTDLGKTGRLLYNH